MELDAASESPRVPLIHQPVPLIREIQLAHLPSGDVSCAASGSFITQEDVARRRFPRYAIHIPFLYTPDTPLSTSTGAGWTRALSEGGTTVELSERLRPLTRLRLRLRTDRGTIEAEAKVFWSGGRVTEGGGVIHGLAFTWMAPNHFQTLRDMFRPLPIMRHAGVRLPLNLSITCHRKNPARPPLWGRTGNVNRGGSLPSSPPAPAPGTGLKVTVHAPAGPVVEGTVVWMEPPENWRPGESIGHGFQFSALTWSTLISLGFLLVETT